MANLKGVDIKKGRLGSNTLGGSDAISGIIIGCVASPKLAFESPAVVFNMRDVEQFGITDEFDKTNNVNAYRHLSEFYRMSGEGNKLHLMLVAQETTEVEICDQKAKKLLAYAGGEIRQLAIAVNPKQKATMLKGMAADVFNAIPKAQALADWAYQNHMPCQIFLEGFAYGGTASSAANLRAIKDVNATKVSVVVGQDFIYAKGKAGNAQKFADVGTVLGVCAKATVNQNIGENESFDLTDATLGSWLEPGLSSHIPNKEVLEDLQTLEDKGFIFGITYPGMAGVRLNNDHVCTPVIVDSDNSMNEHTLSYGRVVDKAVRGLRNAYLPKVKTNWAVDEKTGKLSPGTVVAMEDIGDRVFEDMIKRGEISYGKTYVDAESDLLVDKVLKVGYKIVPRGTIGEIKGVVNLKTRV